MTHSTHSTKKRLSTWFLTRKSKSQRTSSFRDTVEALSIAVIIAIFLRLFVIEAFKIPTGSMIPTLKIEDHIFVNKFIYGLRIPFTKIRFFQFTSPKRGDIVVFIFPLNNSKDYIKRVIGIPGDEIEVHGRVVYVNGVPAEKVIQEDRRVLSDVEDADGVDLYSETNGHATHYTQYSKYQSTRDYGPKTVPPDHLFVMGDNRDNSYDSRGWGFVPMNHLKGKALFVWLSLDPLHRYSFLGLPSIRWERFGKMIR